jgi:catecholate siderophore receptor
MLYSDQKFVKPGLSNAPSNAYKMSALKLAVRSVLFGSSLAFLAPISAMAETEVDSEITLPQVDVIAPVVSDTQPVKGYNAKRSTTATKTDTELRDVPQAISVITQDQIKDQSVQSIAEAVRYVPGVQAAQGEGNRDALIFW